MKIFDWNRFNNNATIPEQMVVMLLIFAVVMAGITAFVISPVIRLIICIVVAYYIIKTLQKLWKKGYFFPDLNKEKE